MPTANASARIPRPVPDLVEALRRHVEVLRKYARWAFEDGDPAFLGEVAGKLRLLVLERGRNAPLLLYLLDEFEVDIEVSMRPPFSPSTLCLDDYLDSLAFAGQTSKGYARLGKLLLPLIVRRQVEKEMPKNMESLKRQLETTP